MKKEEIIKIRNEYNENFYRGRFFEKHEKDYEEVPLAKCNARIGRATDYTNFILWSYDTLIAWYDVESNTLYNFGRYSSTSYQHVRKFRMWLFDNCACLRRSIPFEEVNLELENWYR